MVELEVDDCHNSITGESHPFLKKKLNLKWQRQWEKYTGRREPMYSALVIFFLQLPKRLAFRVQPVYNFLTTLECVIPDSHQKLSILYGPANCPVFHPCWVTCQ